MYVCIDVFPLHTIRTRSMGGSALTRRTLARLLPYRQLDTCVVQQQTSTPTPPTSLLYFFLLSEIHSLEKYIKGLESQLTE